MPDPKAEATALPLVAAKPVMGASAPRQRRLPPRRRPARPRRARRRDKVTFDDVLKLACKMTTAD